MPTIIWAKLWKTLLLQSKKVQIGWTSTVLGMGRGPGNVTTESLIIELEKKFNKKSKLL